LAVAIVLYAVLGLTSFFSPLFGLTILLVEHCSIEPVVHALETALPSGGTLCAGDFISLALFVRILWVTKRWRRVESWLVALVIWLACAGVLGFLRGTATLAEAGRTVLRSAVLWTIPLVVLDLDRVGRRRILRIAGLLAAGLCLIQAIALIVKSPEFLNAVYYQYSVFEDGVEAARYHIDVGAMLRLYPRGALLCEMLFIFLATGVFLRGDRREMSPWRLVLLAMLALFVATLGARSIVFAMIVASLWVLIRAAKRGIRPAGLAVLAAMPIVLLAVPAGMRDVFLGSLSERLSATIAGQGPDTWSIRAADNAAASGALGLHPLFGLGKWSLGEGSELGLGQDAHPLLMTGLMGGIPAILLMIAVLGALTRCGFRNSRQGSRRATAATAAVIYAMTLALINTTPVFVMPQHQIPFGLFLGVMLWQDVE
jgi:hypothetical protein